MRQKRAPHTRIHQYEALIRLPQRLRAILPLRAQHLPMAPQIKTRVRAFNNLHVRPIVWDDFFGYVRLAVQDEDEVRGVVQAVPHEEFEVASPVLSFEVCVGY